MSFSSFYIAPCIPETLLSRQELAKRFGCSVSSLKRYERHGGLKPVKIGPRLVRYRLVDIIEYELRGMPSK